MIKAATGALLALATFGWAPAAGAARLNALIVDGVNNHDWKNSTPVLRRMLEESGRFRVTVSTSPARGASAAAWAGWRPAFDRYDVVISNFNGGDHGRDVVMWPAPVEKSFEAYVRRGGGFVSYHAANNAFPGWRAYEEMVGLLWRPKSFGPSVIFDKAGGKVILPAGFGRDPNHPRRYDFDVDVAAPRHPITSGFPAHFHATSEQLTYGQHGPRSAVEGNALTFLTYAWCEAIQENEPMDWVRRWGRGRVYVTMLGHAWHDEPSPNFNDPGFRAMFLRGAEWAATGRVTLPAAVPPS